MNIVIKKIDNPYKLTRTIKIIRPIKKLAIPFIIGTNTDVPIICTFSAWLVKLYTCNLLCNDFWYTPTNRSVFNLDVAVIHSWLTIHREANLSESDNKVSVIRIK